jgi:hypothetical protein
VDIILRLKLVIGETQIQQKLLVYVISLNFVILTMNLKHIYPKMIYAQKDKQVRCAYHVIIMGISIGEKDFQAQVKDV